MIRQLRPLPPLVVAELRAFAERSLSREEFDAYVNAPMGDYEREEIDSLIRWFRRRYPSAAERLAYSRRAYQRAKALMPPSE